jgi:hypothetical protein
MIFEEVSQGQRLDPKKAFCYGQFVQAAYTVLRNPLAGNPLRPEPARRREIRPDECRGCHRISHLQRTLADQGEQVADSREAERGRAVGDRRRRVQATAHW